MLSLCTGQVAHALLTRPPLSQITSIRRLQLSDSARLACVKHAASVHPEPGSNSYIKVFKLSMKLGFLNIKRYLSVFHYCFSLFLSFKKLRNLRGLSILFLVVKELLSLLEKFSFLLATFIIYHRYYKLSIRNLIFLLNFRRRFPPPNLAT